MKLRVRPRWLAGKRNHATPAAHHRCWGVAGGGGAGRGAGGTVRAVWRDAPQCRPFLFSWSCVEIHGIYFLKPFVSLFTQVTKQLILSWVEPGPCLSYIEILRQITHEHSRRAAYLQTIETVSICK